jgi:hypothetical protein
MWKGGGANKMRDFALKTEQTFGFWQGELRILKGAWNVI